MRVLRIDHSRLSRVLREIDVLQERLQASPAETRTVLVEAMHYLLHYQHVFHHPSEDRLFERISARDPRFAREMRTLIRDHRSGLRQAETLVANLARLSPTQLRRGPGAWLAKRLSEYVAHTREHMRSEEAVFYAQSELVLTDADWAALSTHARPDDPMGDASLLARDYPRLAGRVFPPGAGPAGASAFEAGSRGVRNALRDGVDLLFETYGELFHDALDLARTNFAGLRSVRSPWGLVRAAGPIASRSCRFVARCLTAPPRVAIDAATNVAAAIRQTAPARPR